MIGSNLMGSVSASALNVAPTGGASPVKQYHRLLLSSSHLGGQPSLFEMEMHETLGGADVATFANGYGEGESSASFDGNNVFDNSTGSRYVGVGAGSAAYGRCWVAQNFGVVQEVKEIRLEWVTAYLGNGPQRVRYDVSDDGVTWHKLKEFPSLVMPTNPSTNDFPLPSTLPDRQYNVSGIDGSGQLSTSTSAFASKGGVFQANVDIEINGVSFGHSGSTGAHEAVVAIMSDNGTNWNIDSILARKSFTAIVGENTVSLDTPVTVLAGQYVGIIDTFTGGAADTTSCGLQFPTSTVVRSNPIFTTPTNPGVRHTSRSLTTGPTTDKSTSAWATGMMARAKNPDATLNAVSARYWRFEQVDSSASANIQVGLMHLLDENGFAIDIPTGGGITSTPTVTSGTLSLINDGSLESDIRWSGVSNLTIQMDFAAPVTPAYVQVGSEASSANTPTDWILASSDDAVTWTPRLTVSGDTGWGVRQIRTFKIA